MRDVMLLVNRRCIYGICPSLIYKSGSCMSLEQLTEGSSIDRTVCGILL